MLGHRGSESRPRQRRGIVVEDPFAHEFALGPSPADPEPLPSAAQDQASGLAVVLDCANIGWAFGRSCFSVHGVLLAMRFFDSLGIASTGFLPASYARRKPSDDSRGNALMETEQLEELTALVDGGRITLVPPGCEDDLFVLSHGESTAIAST